MTTLVQEVAAVEARLVNAHTAALSVDPHLVFLEGLRNLKKFEPSAQTHYLRGYKRRTSAVRLGAGEGFDRYFAVIFTQIMIPEEEGDELVAPIWQSILSSFVQNGDGLIFEEAPDLTEGVEDGTHYVSVGSFPYYFDRLHD